MLETFELKSYKQLEFFLGVMNAALAVVTLLVFYYGLLTTQHRATVDQVVKLGTAQPLLGLVPLGAVALLWAWVATQILRLHDRVHEPHIRKWRAGYDADFVLRALVYAFEATAPAAFFERAYTDKRARTKCLQRLFYNFLGDYTKTAEGRRLFFYGEMARYWTVALTAVYCFAILIVSAAYSLLSGGRLPAAVVLVVVLVLLISEVYSNHVLDSAHQITLDQIAALVKAHRDDWPGELAAVLKEEGYARGRP